MISCGYDETSGNKTSQAFQFYILWFRFYSDCERTTAIEIDLLESSSVEYGFSSISRELYEPVEQKEKSSSEKTANCNSCKFPRKSISRRCENLNDRQ